MTERKPHTDEYKKVLMAQAIGNSQKRSRSTEEIRAAMGWKSFPMTIGLLVALVFGVVFIASAVLGYQSDLSTKIERAINSHNGSASAHQHIREEVKAQAKQTRELIRQLREEMEKPKRGRRWNR
jgi:pyruvate/2-oxoacid:ferredoxin oxidoreductase beta subunit